MGDLAFCLSLCLYLTSIMKFRETPSALMPCRHRSAAPFPVLARDHDGISTSLSSPFPSPFLLFSLSPSLSPSPLSLLSLNRS